MNWLIRIATNETLIALLVTAALGYFAARVFPAMKMTEKESWRKICDSSSVQMVRGSYCYTCRGSSHTFLEPLYSGELK